MSQSRSTVWTSHPTFRFDSSLQRRTKPWSKLPMSTKLWTNSKSSPKSCETLCFFWELQCFIVLLSDSVIDMKIFIFFNHSLKFLWAQQYELESWFFWLILFSKKLGFFISSYKKRPKNFSLSKFDSQKLPKLEGFDTDSQIFHNGGFFMVEDVKFF